jgi:hypothetical protein
MQFLLLTGKGNGEERRRRGKKMSQKREIWMWEGKKMFVGG